jgi:hypothetical protein
MYFPSIDKIKDLHHDEGIENKCKMTRVHFGLLKNRIVILIALNSIETTTTDSSPNYSIPPFKLRIENVFCLIVQ